MAAGDVVIHLDSGRALRGKRIIAGIVTLDGSNPTPVALASYLKAVKGATVAIQSAAIPGDTLMGASVGVSGTTLNIYAWATNGTDPTPTASTVNNVDVSFIAWGDQ